MATEPGRGSTPSPEPALSSAQARAALGGLDADRVQLAERVVTPWWYHPCLGLILAVIVAGQALPLGYSLLVTLPGVLAMVLLLRIYTHRYGVAVTAATGPETRRLQIAVGVLAGATIGAGLILNLAGAPPGWTLIPMVVVLVGIILVGRRYDQALRSELAQEEWA